MGSDNLNDELARVATLHATGLLDTPEEATFDEIAHLAAHLCRVPIATISLVDESRQWFKSHIGLEARETPRDISFCTHTIMQDQIMMVEDATLDPRFCSSPLVTGPPCIRFYAGFPLISREGFRLGALCVIDHKPRSLTKHQRIALAILARQVSAQIELRRAASRLKDELRMHERTERALVSSQAEFGAFMDNSPLSAFIKNSEGVFVYVNKSFERLMGRSSEELIGCTVYQLVAREDANRLTAHDAEVLASGSPSAKTEEIVTPGGVRVTLRISKFALPSADGEVRLGAIVADVTEIERHRQEIELANANLHARVITDPLTGLRTRGYFEEMLSVEFGRAKRYGGPLSLLLVDADRFKSVNDTQGHAAGDRVLRLIGRLLVQDARSSDTVARYGGEEFAILLPETAEAAALAIAERIRAGIAEQGSEGIRVTVSIGVSSLRPDVSEPAELTAEADAALYASKESGRNCVTLYSSESPVRTTLSA